MVCISVSRSVGIVFGMGISASSRCVRFCSSGVHFCQQRCAFLSAVCISVSSGVHFCQQRWHGRWHRLRHRRCSQCTPKVDTPFWCSARYQGETFGVFDAHQNAHSKRTAKQQQRTAKTPNSKVKHRSLVYFWCCSGVLCCKFGVNCLV